MLIIQNLIDSRFNKPVSLSLGSRECLAIKGQNGSGKTTLLRYITGVLESDSIQLDTSYSYLGHALGLFSELSVCDYLKSPSGIFKDSLFTKRIAQLSAGQKQQLAFMLVRRNNLWILDEPTAHLDKDATEAFYEVLQAHCEQGGGVILATHDEVPEWVRILSL